MNKNLKYQVFPFIVSLVFLCVLLVISICCVQTYLLLSPTISIAIISFSVTWNTGFFYTCYMRISHIIELTLKSSHPDLFVCSSQLSSFLATLQVWISMAREAEVSWSSYICNYQAGSFSASSFNFHFSLMEIRRLDSV